MFHFEEPVWFALFLLTPGLFWLRYFWRGRSGRISFSFQIWGGGGFYPDYSWHKGIIIITDAAYALGAAALVIALAGPGIIDREDVYLSRGIDIMIVLDQSPSMAAEDFPPANRFDTARDMIRQFISGRTGDSIGLVSFGSVAMLRSPPTTDYDWLIERLESLEIRELGDDTAIGMGLAVATLHLSHSTATEKIILLLTDGDDNAGEISPETASGIAASHDIRIYSIGIGQQGQAPITLRDQESGVVTRGTLITNFDEETLGNIARTTGGTYWKASSPGALETVLQSIDVVESVERHLSVRVNRQPLHHWFILGSLVLIIPAYLIRKSLMKEIV